MSSNVRVRFAPSPTGFLHIGGLRTALFNFLFAKKMNGKFILRLEDTDRTRIVPESIADIYENLKWIGIDWDEGPDKGGNYGPYIQSERLSIYKQYIDILLDKKAAYKCFCSTERLEQIKQEQTKNKQPTRYDKKCIILNDEEIKKKENEGQKYVVRLKIPAEGITEFEDKVRGKIAWANKDMDDLVLLKSDGYPTYHLANVVDDHLMSITHVMRGEEWISSTPKHILIYHAFDWISPEFIHLPVIISAQGGKLSKRFGAVSVREFKEEGYLPEALLNFLVLLGWSYDDKREKFTKADLMEMFNVEGIGKNSPVFDRSKLDWMNGEYIREFSIEKIFEYTKTFLEKNGLLKFDIERLKTAMLLEKEKVKKLSEYPDLISFLFFDDYNFSPDAIKILKKENILNIITRLKKEFENFENFTVQGLENKVRDFCQAENLKTKDVFHPVRAIISGRTIGPGLFEMLEFLGKEEVIKRMNKITQIQSQSLEILNK